MCATPSSFAHWWMLLCSLLDLSTNYIMMISSMLVITYTLFYTMDAMLILQPENKQWETRASKRCRGQLISILVACEIAGPVYLWMKSLDLGLPDGHLLSVYSLLLLSSDLEHKMIKI